MIRKIAGKHQATQIKHISKNNFFITDKKNIADFLAETFFQKFIKSKLPAKIYYSQAKRGKVQIKLQIKKSGTIE